MTYNERYVLPLAQLQPPNIVDRDPITVIELKELRGNIEEQQKKINNSEMMGIAGALLKKELWQLTLQDERLIEQLLETKKPLVNAENQQESCRRQVELLNRELEEAKSQAESKAREFVALVDELEIGEEDIRKFRNRVKTEQTTKVVQTRLEAINTKIFFSRPPNLYEMLLMPRGATTTTTLKHYKTFFLLCHPDKGGRYDLFKIVLQPN